MIIQVALLYSILLLNLLLSTRTSLHQFFITFINMRLFGRQKVRSPLTSDDESTSNKPQTKPKDKIPTTSTQSSLSTSEAPENDQMIKRRVKINLASITNPMMTDTIFEVHKRYRNLKLVSIGSYGIVVSATDDSTDERVAIKKIFNAFTSSRMARHVLREVRLLHYLKHPHIVPLLDIDVPNHYKAWEEVYIVTPLLSRTLREAMLQGRLEDSISQKRAAYQMLVALLHLHDAGIMHRDIKSYNILLDDDNNVQLCDLGEARFYSKANRDWLNEEKEDSTKEPELTGHLTTMIVTAPEIALGAPYDAEVDIWAAGCVIAELVHPKHDHLFDTISNRAHLQEIVDIVGYPTQDIMDVLPAFGQWYLKRLKRHSGKSMKDILGDQVDPLAMDLLQQMLKFSPKQRISAKQALQHPWFDDVRQPNEEVKEGYQFEKSEPPKGTSKAELKSLVWDEVVSFHPWAPSMGVR